MRTHLVMISSVALLRVCNSTSSTGTDAAPPPPPPVAAANPSAPAAVPETVTAGPHGGVVASSGGVTTEVLTQPDGNLVTYFTNAQGLPVQPSTLTVSLRKSDGTDQPIAMSYDDSIQGYMGAIANIPPSSYPVDEVAQFAGMVSPLQLSTPPVTVTALAPVPTPRHHGHIERFGDKICETVIGRDGNVAMWWTDQNGNPVPPDAIGMSQVGVWVGGRRMMIPVRYEDGYFKGHADFQPGADVSLELPDVRVDGRPYFGGRWRHPVMVDQIQVVAQPEPYPVFGQPNYIPPAVIVQRPGWNVPPGWNPHPPVVVARVGYAPPRPGVVYAPPRPGFVVQQPGIVAPPGQIRPGMGMQPGVGMQPQYPHPGPVINTVRPGVPVEPQPGVTAHAPMMPMHPGEPMHPVEPVRPGEPMHPAEPVRPMAEPMHPMLPVHPMEPARPVVAQPQYRVTPAAERAPLPQPVHVAAPQQPAVHAVPPTAPPMHVSAPPQAVQPRPGIPNNQPIQHPAAPPAQHAGPPAGAPPAQHAPGGGHGHH